MSACTFAVGLLHGNNPSSSRREHPCCTTTSSSGHGTNRQTQPSLALALTSLVMAKLILVLWVYSSECKYSTSGGQRCAAPRKVGGTNDVTVSNRVNLVDPVQRLRIAGDEDLKLLSTSYKMSLRDPNIEEKLFPHLYPFGRGGFDMTLRSSSVKVVGNSWPVCKNQIDAC